MDWRWMDELSPYTLARMADCMSPDSPESPGAKLLTLVALDVRNACSYRPEDAGRWAEAFAYDGTDHEIADAAPSIYTFERWQQFVDLGAWQEDLDEIGGMPDDMETAAGWALYAIASRLVSELLTEADRIALEDAEVTR